MPRCPREDDHTLIRHRRMAAMIIGIQADDVERIELVVCPVCTTSIGRPCEDARHMESSDGSGLSLCGVPAEGALLVDTYQQSDCPLCHTIIDQAAKEKCS